MSSTISEQRQKAASLVSQMTLEEKASLCSGDSHWTTSAVERVAIPSIFMADGPHGLRRQLEGSADSIPATCFPTASALASSWNRELVNEVGQALGRECQANDVQILLGPGMNMKRSPLGGRNFEYFSEDPVLTGEIATAFVKGVQAEGVGTSAKHFAANNQEFERLTNNSIIDERTLRELYLSAFETVVKKAQPWSLMCAYNLLNGVHCAEDAWLLDDLLRGEWGHEGFVMSDWGAVCDRIAGIRARLQLEMPSSQGVTDRQIVEAVRGSDLDEARLDQCVEDLLAVLLHAYARRKEGATYNQDAHHQLARAVSGECIVLLKNEGALLPLDLSQPHKIAVIGAFAKTPRYQGAGSSLVHPTKLENAWEELQKLAGPGVEFTFAAAYDGEGDTTDELVEEARKTAADADVALFFGGLPDSYESECFDRPHMDLPEGQRRVIEAVSAVQPQNAVILFNGSCVSMPWADNVPAIIEGWLGGQAGGGAIAEVLSGKTNPSGKLSESFPARLEDSASFTSFPGMDGETLYGEGVFVGYRHHDARKIAAQFPFGHGLSYTRFEYSDISVEESDFDDEHCPKVSVKVKNVGERAGKEVVQLYVHECENRIPRPPKALRHFEKVTLEPGDEKTVTFQLTRRDFAYWDVRVHDWSVNAGQFELQAGGSSADLPLKASVKVTPANVRYPTLTRESLIKEFRENPKTVPLFEEMFNTSMAAMMPEETRKTMSEDAMQKARKMYETFLLDLPAWKVVHMSQGAVTEERLREILKQANDVA